VAGSRGGARAPVTCIRGKGAGSAAPLESATPVNIHDWCDKQDALAVIDHNVALDRHGIGCCPFGWRHGDATRKAIHVHHVVRKIRLPRSGPFIGNIQSYI
jgi:hypothetical protein